MLSWLCLVWLHSVVFYNIFKWRSSISPALGGLQWYNPVTAQSGLMDNIQPRKMWIYIENFANLVIDFSCLTHDQLVLYYDICYEWQSGIIQYKFEHTVFEWFILSIQNRTSYLMNNQRVINFCICFVALRRHPIFHYNIALYVTYFYFSRSFYY